MGSKWAYGSYRHPLYFSNFETFKVEKNSSTRESDMNWQTNEKFDKDAFCGFILFLVAVAAIYCIDPSNVELFVHT